MSHVDDDAARVRDTHNTARFFTQTRHVAWVLLAATVAWGFLGYRAMPQRKDPDVPPREALVVAPWPGASAEKVELRVARRVEEAIAENAHVELLSSDIRTGVAYVRIKLTDDVAPADRGKELDDIRLKLDAIRDLPEGAGPLTFVKDFGDTATLFLTIASPVVRGAELGLRAAALRAALERARGGDSRGRSAVVIVFPDALAADSVREQLSRFAVAAHDRGLLRDASTFGGPNFAGVDGIAAESDAALLAFARDFAQRRLQPAEIHPDVWEPFVVRSAADAEARMREGAAAKYSYRELREYADAIKRGLLRIPEVGKISLAGSLEERIFLDYSQERLAAYGLRPSALETLLDARNIALPGGVFETGDKRLRVDPSGELRSERELGDILVPTPGGASVQLRELVTVTRGYESPARFVSSYGRRAEDGAWQRTRAITLSIQMRNGRQIAEFDRAVDAALDDLRTRLPEDVVLARTPDQSQQVEESMHLFMSSLYEAVALVVLVSLIGFWEWRSALLMALSIPITLALTFGLMQLLGVDLQQVSIASLIIALGLLVDDPVVAGDAIKRELARGQPRSVAAWLGPTKLATAILYATITNIAAYLPFLLISGDTGTFLYSLPVVIAASLVASRLVSMTFIPLLGYYLLRPKAEPSIEQRRSSGFGAIYYRVGRWAIAQRGRVLAASLAFLALGFGLATQLKTQFFPKDLAYLSYVDIWLPEDAPLAATHEATRSAEAVIREVVSRYEREQARQTGEPRSVLRSLTAFVGGGAPHFWSSAVPEQNQTNYAQILIEVTSNRDTQPLIPLLQRALSARVAGALVDVRQLETGAPIGIPLALRISGEDIPTLRRLAGEAKAILRADPDAERVRDNWGAESFAIRLEIDAARANAAGLTHLDVAASSAGGLNGATVGTLREGEEQIPIVARLRADERASLGDFRNLYVHAQQGAQRAPLESISRIVRASESPRIQRRSQYRTITVQAFARDGALPSEVLARVTPALERFEASLPPGYRLEIGGEYEEQTKGFRNLAFVMLLSVLAIFLALVIQFKHAIKPFIVFAAIPYGIAGALIALWVMGTPFGFTGFLGIASLVGVIVSHIIVLFDFIEEAREHGAALEDALLDAEILRLRPVLITVGATVIALFPLAAHGGPLWEPLCYAQIGGLTAATGITLLLVPVLYATAVLDLKIVAWHTPAGGSRDSSVAHAGEPEPVSAPAAALASS